MQIKTWRDPYEAGFSPTKPTKIELNPGLTVLVGCNGSGKTTLLHNIEEEVKKNHIPCKLYNNLQEGGFNSINSLIQGYGLPDEENAFNMGISLWTASEGEAIKMNLGRHASLYKEFLSTGLYKDNHNRFAAIFSDKAKEISQSDKRMLLFDAVDSGLSVDAVVEIKALFEEIIQDAQAMNIEFYIIIAANEYELARNASCFDVVEGKYITFKDYEDYRKFILKSRIKKEKRLEKQMLWQRKQEEKKKLAYQKRKEKYLLLIEQIKDKANKENRNLSWRESDKISEYERIIERGEKW